MKVGCQDWIPGTLGRSVATVASFSRKVRFGHLVSTGDPARDG